MKNIKVMGKPFKEKNFSGVAVIVKNMSNGSKNSTIVLTEDENTLDVVVAELKETVK